MKNDLDKVIQKFDEVENIMEEVAKILLDNHNELIRNIMINLPDEREKAAMYLAVKDTQEFKIFKKFIGNPAMHENWIKRDGYEESENSGFIRIRRNSNIYYFKLSHFEIDYERK